VQPLRIAHQGEYSMTQTPPRDAIILRWFFLILLVSALGLACVGSVVAIAKGGIDDTQMLQLLVYSPLIFLLCGAIGLSGTMILQSGRLVIYIRVLLILLLFTCAIGLTLLLSPQLQRSSGADLFSRLIGNLTLIVFSMLMMVQLLILKTKNILIRCSSVFLIISQCAAVALVLIFSWTEVLDVYANIVSGSLTPWIILNLLGILLVPQISRNIDKPKTQKSETIESKATLNLTCPECQTQQSLPAGLVRCSKCKFTMIIELEEPRCECGYQLYNLQSNYCPECGIEIPESDRWASESAQ